MISKIKEIEVEQKISLIYDADYRLLEKQFSEGWIIKSISACCDDFHKYCYVLLERGKKDA